MNSTAVFDTKSATFVDDVLSYIRRDRNFSIDPEYSDLIENCVRSIAVIADFQKMILQRSSEMEVNETRSSILSGYVSHFITELISARDFIEELERKFLEDMPEFPQDDLLIPKFDDQFPDLKRIRNTLEHNAERRRGLRSGRRPIPSIDPLYRPDGTLANCGELVIFPPSTVKCHLSDGSVGEVNLEIVTPFVCRVLTETIKRFPSQCPNE